LSNHHRLILQDPRFLKGALNATFRAIGQSPKAPNVGPIAASALARRRGINQPNKGSTEV
jgi:p90 ribosomal S6 kinase